MIKYNFSKSLSAQEQKILTLAAGEIDIYDLQSAYEFLLDNFLLKKKKIIVYGVGLHTYNLLKLASQDRLSLDNIICFADKYQTEFIDSQGKVYEVISPEKMINYDFDYVVMSTNINANQFYGDIVKFVTHDKIINLYAHYKNKIQLYCEYKHTHVNKIHLDSFINDSDNTQTLIVIFQYLPISHLKTIKHLSYYFKIVMIGEYSKQKYLADDSIPWYNFSTNEISYIVQKLKNCKIYTLSTMYNNYISALVVSLSTVEVYVEFADITSSAYKNGTTLKKYCPNIENELILELIIWKYADGIIFKEGSGITDPLIKEHRPKKTIRFFMYADIDGIVDKKDCDEKIKLVYVGGVHPVGSNNDAEGIHQSLYGIAKILTAQGFEFHIYNAFDMGETNHWSNFTTLAEQIKDFYYHQCLSIFELSKEISKYDMAWYVFDFSQGSVENWDFYRYGMSTKIGSYIEAELPILISKEHEFMADVVESLDAGVRVSFDDIYRLNNVISKDTINIMKKKMSGAKQRYSYQHNIKKLVDFIGS